MKKIGYHIFKWWIKAGLFFYYKKIKIHGRQHIPKNKPILFVANHQNALLDALLVAVYCKKKPYYLTRGDIFKGSFARNLFGFLQMVPIYRIRDGKHALGKNNAILDRCAHLLATHNDLLIYPEGSHNLKRRVRPLSKGFTRILFRALAIDPELDIRLVPVGVNYAKATHFPDRVALYFGEDIKVRNLYNENDVPFSVKSIKNEVFNGLTQLTTHIEDVATYELIIKKLDAIGVDYLNPFEVNAIVNNLEQENSVKKRNTVHRVSQFFKTLFIVLNSPLVVPWRLFLKPKVQELEFMGTFRFLYSLVLFPLFYLTIFFLLAHYLGYGWSIGIVLLHMVLNLAYVKLCPTT